MIKEILYDLDERYKDAYFLKEGDTVRFTEECILAIHDDQVKEFGGEYGVRDVGLFRSACEMPYQEMFGTELFPTPYDKAARYLFAFANYQIFVDGNKRTGLTVADVYLKCNGIILDLSVKESYNLTMNIANHKLENISDISNYLQMNSHLDQDLKRYMDKKFISNEKENDYGQGFTR